MQDAIEQPASPAGGRAGIVAVVGRANVGKSSLLNTILEEKVSIVSPVAQTTRNVIRAILTEPRGQLVFLDTPGVHKAQTPLGTVMNKSARKTAEGSDVLLFVVDGSQPPRMEDEGWMARLARSDRPVVIAVNKQDRGTEHAETLRAAWAAQAAANAGVVDGAGPAVTPEWFAVSALTGAGVPALVDRLFQLVPEGEPLFPADVLTDYPRRLAIGDVVREKLFGVLREELPHNVTVWVDDLAEEEDGWTVQAIVYVAKPSQKGIVIGDRGRLIRKVKRQSEAELANMFGHRVTVDLWVKIEKDWSKNFWLLKKFGYV